MRTHCPARPSSEASEELHPGHEAGLQLDPHLHSPYDTLEEVIGVRGSPGSGSLADFGVRYRALPLVPSSGAIDWEALATAVEPGGEGASPRGGRHGRSCMQGRGWGLKPTRCMQQSVHLVPVSGWAPRRRCPQTLLTAAPSVETRVALLQRSCGYADRPTLSLEDIGRAVRVIKSQSPHVVVAVDNCYGEFTDTTEPGTVGRGGGGAALTRSCRQGMPGRCAPAPSQTLHPSVTAAGIPSLAGQVGADLCMGSLIKNPGGTLVPGGGYVAGKRRLVEAALARLTAPGIGSEAGAVTGETLRLMFQGRPRDGSGTGMKPVTGPPWLDLM